MQVVTWPNARSLLQKCLSQFIGMPLRMVLCKYGITGKPCVRKWSGIDATEPEKEIVDVI